jgi:hypothetical protein
MSDLDNDGRRELLIGAPGTDTAGRGNSGQAMILSSSDKTLLWASDATYVRRGWRFGTCVAEMGDHDGDGVPDFLVGAPGALNDTGVVMGFSGRTGERLLLMVGPGKGSRLGQSCLGMPSGFPVRSVLGAPGAAVGPLTNAGMVFLCSTDGDGDGAPDCLDNCPALPNPGQVDADGDGFGDDCDTCIDPDGDGFAETSVPNQACGVDLCPGVFNTDQTDSDGDGIGDACDNCAVIPNPAQLPQEACVQLRGRIKIGKKTPSHRNRFSAELVGAPFDASVLEQAVAAASTFTLFDRQGAPLFLQEMPLGMLHRRRPRHVVYSLGAGFSAGIERVEMKLSRKGKLTIKIRGHGSLVPSGTPRARLDLTTHHLAAAHGLKQRPAKGKKNKGKKK